VNGFNKTVLGSAENAFNVTVVGDWVLGLIGNEGILGIAPKAYLRSVLREMTWLCG
jgi:hypothetical protein